jgi:hypothetical protein
VAVSVAACTSSNPKPYELTDSVIASLDCDATRTVSNRLNALNSDSQVPANRTELEAWLPDGADFDEVMDAVNQRRKAKNCDSTTSTPPTTTTAPSSTTGGPTTASTDCPAQYVQVNHPNNPLNRFVPNGIDAKTPEESRNKDLAAMASDVNNLALTAKLLGFWQTANPKGLASDDGSCLSPEGAKVYKSVFKMLTDDETILSFRTAPAKWYNTGVDGDLTVVAEKPGFTGNSKALFYELPDGTVVVKLVRSGNLAYPRNVEDITPGLTDNPVVETPKASPTATATPSRSARTSTPSATRRPSASAPAPAPAPVPVPAPTQAKPKATKVTPKATRTPSPTAAPSTRQPTSTVIFTTSTTTIPAPGH